MRLDPQAAELLRSAGRLDPRPLNAIPIAEARALEIRKLQFAGPPEPVASVSDIEIPGPSGDIPARVYQPTSEDGLPVVVFLHGGGWTLGGLQESEVQSRALAVAARALVVAVDYRLAPEHRYPAALLDAHAVVLAIGERHRRIAVAGDSAGGNLAAAVTLLIRDRGGPRLAHQLLIYPMLDPTGTYPSREANGAGYGLTNAIAEWFWGNYLGSADGHDPYAVPMRASSLTGLPSATVMTAEYDPLRDEALAYGRRLQGAGVAVEMVTYAGQIHGFWSYGGIIDATGDLTRDAGRVLRRALHDGIPEGEPTPAASTDERGLR